MGGEVKCSAVDRSAVGGVALRSVRLEGGLTSGDDRTHFVLWGRGVAV